MVQSGFRPKQIYEQVADQIRAAILAGTYTAGSRLPSERDLAKQLNISRPAIREAIGALQNEGIVVTRRGAGTYVAEVAAQAPVATAFEREPDFSPMGTLEVRLLIEPTVARMAARQGKRDALAETYLARMAGVKDITDLRQQELWTECDRLFHRQLSAMTGNALMVRIADQVADSMNEPLWKRLRDDGIYDEERIKLYVAEHRLIYEAIASGDEDAAAFYVEQHLKRVRRDIETLEA